MSKRNREKVDDNTYREKDFDFQVRIGREEHKDKGATVLTVRYLIEGTQVVRDEVCSKLIKALRRET